MQLSNPVLETEPDFYFLNNTNQKMICDENLVYFDKK